MTNSLVQSALELIDVQHLHYFSVVAQEQSLRKAAELLFMTQPPLSRHIKQLEERLGVTLFVRHNKGLTLTDEGKKVLQIVKPLLKLKEETYTRLRNEIRPQARPFRVGFTTAIEQGVFARLEVRLRRKYGDALTVIRENSPKLVQDIHKGKIDGAIVGLPLLHEWTLGLAVQELRYTEPLVAALPQEWLSTDQMKNAAVSLAEFSGKPLFWFPRASQPAFFDVMKHHFQRIGYTPEYIEEPAEHDVFLARIAAGEGMGLFAASFAAIQRKGVVFCELVEKESLFLQLGCVARPDCEEVLSLLSTLS